MAFEPRVQLDENGFPIFIEPLNIDDLLRMRPSNTDDIAAIFEYKALYGLESPEQIRRAQIKYLERFNITSDSPQFAQQMEQLSTEANSNRVMVATARRVAEQQQTNAALGGRVDVVCVYVNEGPDPCDACLVLNGEEAPYSWFVSTSSRPGDQCYGGDNCLCTLIPIERV
jgi:hypothetical protein